MRALVSRSGPEIENFASSFEWSAFALAVRQHGAVIPCRQYTSPFPGFGAAHRIVVTHAPIKKLQFSIADDTVNLICDPTHIETLSRNLEGMSADLPAYYHAHMEYVSDSHFIAEGSVPTTLRIGADRELGGHIDATVYGMLRMMRTN